MSIVCRLYDVWGTPFLVPLVSMEGHERAELIMVWNICYQSATFLSQTTRRKQKRTRTGTHGNTTEPTWARIQTQTHHHTQTKKRYSCLTGACCMNQTECRTEKAQWNQGMQEIMQYYSVLREDKDVSERFDGLGQMHGQTPCDIIILSHHTPLSSSVFCEDPLPAC